MLHSKNHAFINNAGRSEDAARLGTVLTIKYQEEPKRKTILEYL